MSLLLQASSQNRLPLASPVDPRPAVRGDAPGLRLLAAVLLGMFVAAYAPVWLWLAESWDRNADYAHGWLIVPIALYLLWYRREKFPTGWRPAIWSGLSLVALALCLRSVGALAFVRPVEGWSIPLWLAGLCLMLGGKDLLRWALPSLLLLVCMVPLPWSLEQGLSGPLQQVAARLSSTLLLIAGQPALAEGQTVLLGDHRLDIESACSGLRMFLAFAALAVAVAAFSRRPLWQRAMLVVAVFPLAIFVNALRISVVGMVLMCLPGVAGQPTSLISVSTLHDVTGWSMVPLASLLLLAGAWFVDHLWTTTETIDPAELMHRYRQAT